MSNVPEGITLKKARKWISSYPNNRSGAIWLLRQRRWGREWVELRTTATDWEGARRSPQTPNPWGPRLLCVHQLSRKGASGAALALPPPRHWLRLKPGRKLPWALEVDFIPLCSPRAGTRAGISRWGWEIENNWAKGKRGILKAHGQGRKGAPVKKGQLCELISQKVTVQVTM